MADFKTESRIEQLADRPLDAYAERFRMLLEQQGYAPSTIVSYVRTIRRLGEIIHGNGIQPKELTADLAQALVRSTGWPGDHGQSSVFQARRYATYLAELGVAKPIEPPTIRQSARAALRSDYEDYLRRQRGLTERAIFHCWRMADRFLEFRFGDAGDEMFQITPGDIVAFLQKLTARATPLRDKTIPTHLRNFFQYLFKRAQTATNLALCVPRVAQSYAARLPRHLTPEQVEALIGAVRTDSPVGRRNYAMVLLPARLGLRAPEVVAMQLDDVDWRAGEIIVRGKGKRYDCVPIPRDVGEALAEYVRRDRVTTSRTLFVAGRAPYRPFVDGQVLNSILQQAFVKIGLAPPAKYVGSHVLRHSLATNLLQRGASLPEIADMLRHRSHSSTLIYAKLDMEGLRSIAQPWPVVGGAQ